ncbi:MAG: SIR2 family protein [Chloroflexota bacterium]
MDIPEELIENLRSNDTVLFIGAGISITAGLPSWSDLFQPLAKSIGYPWPSSNLTTDHLLTVAQYYENRNGRHALVRYLMNNLDTAGKKLSEIHFLITQLPVKITFTTNYDDFIEKAYRETGQRTTVIVENLEFAFSKEKDVKVVKLCGDIARPDTIVVTKRDFNVFPTSHRDILEKLSDALETKTVLFLGYSLKDPFINQIWDVINFNFGKFQRLGYCVLFDADPMEAEDMEKRNLRVINLSDKGKSKSELLSDWLKRLLYDLST